MNIYKYIIINYIKTKKNNNNTYINIIKKINV